MLQSPAIRTQLLRKVKRLAYQVERVNREFLSTKLFDRAAIFNIFCQNVLDNRNQRPFDGKATHTTANQNNHGVLGASTAATPFSNYTYTVGHSFESVGRFGLEQLGHMHMISGDGSEKGWVGRICKMFNKYGYRESPSLCCLTSLCEEKSWLPF